MSTPTDGKPRRLGRGLSSLIDTRTPVVVATPPVAPVVQSPPPAPAVAASAPAIAAQGLIQVPIVDVYPNKYQPRGSIDESALSSLVESIKQSGVIQPIVVRPAAAVGGGGVVGGTRRYELVAGERRWRAAKLAGLTELPALVRDLSDEESAEWAIVENVQREDLNAMDRARAFRSLAEKFQLSQGQIAERVGLDRSTVANFMRLTELEPHIQDLVSADRLTFGHAKALLGAPAGTPRIDLANTAMREGWSVRRLERSAAALAAGAKPAGPSPAPAPRSLALEDLEKRLGEYLGTKVTIQSGRQGKRGRVVLEFYGLDHFDGLMSRIGFVASH